MPSAGLTACGSILIDAIVRRISPHLHRAAALVASTVRAASCAWPFHLLLHPRSLFMSLPMLDIIQLFWCVCAF